MSSYKMVRFLTTIMLAVAVLAGVWYLPLFAFEVFVILVVALGLWEFGNLVLAEKSRRIFLILLGISFASLVTWSPSKEWIVLGFIACIFFTFLWEMAYKKPLTHAAGRVGFTILGIGYLSLTLPFWSQLQSLGKEYTLFALIPACLTDTFGFLVGKTIGRKKLAPIISPCKTWEGFFGSLFGAVLGVWIVLKFFGGHSWQLEFKTAWIFGILIGLLAIFGDLFESLIKRSVGAKDSSHLIPGHGGVLDRLDALIFVAPFFYFFLKFQKLL